jgi:hypothetical protein
MYECAYIYIEREREREREKRQRAGVTLSSATVYGLNDGVRFSADTN